MGGNIIRKNLTSVLLLFCLVFNLAGCQSRQPEENQTFETDFVTPVTIESLAAQTAQPAAEITDSEALGLGLYALGESLVNAAGEPVADLHGGIVRYITDSTTNQVRYVLITATDDALTRVYGLDGILRCELTGSFQLIPCFDSLFLTDGQLINLETGDVVLTNVDDYLYTSARALWVYDGGTRIQTMTADSTGSKRENAWLLFEDSEGDQQLLHISGESVPLPDDVAGNFELLNNRYLCYATEENSAVILDLEADEILFMSNAGKVTACFPGGAVLSSGEGEALYSLGGERISGFYRRLDMKASGSQFAAITLDDPDAAILVGQTSDGQEWLDENGTVFLQADASCVVDLLKSDRIFVFDSAAQTLYLLTASGTLLTRLETYTWAWAIDSLQYQSDGQRFLVVSSDALNVSEMALMDSNGNLLISGLREIDSTDGARILGRSTDGWPVLLKMDGTVCAIAEGYEYPAETGGRDWN